MDNESPAQTHESPRVKQLWMIEAKDGQVHVTPPGSKLTYHEDVETACDVGEALARAAHVVRYGGPTRSDISYLHERVRDRAAGAMYGMLAKRLEVMLPSLVANFRPQYPPEYLARVLLDTILNKMV